MKVLFLKIFKLDPLLVSKIEVHYASREPALQVTIGKETYKLHKRIPTGSGYEWV